MMVGESKNSKVMEVVFKAEHTFNGMCYKNQEAFETGVGVCYIAEANFGTFPYDEYPNADWKITVNENEIQQHIDNGEFETRATIFQSVKSYLESYGLNEAAQCQKFIEAIARHAFEIVDWQGIETYIYEIDIEEEWILFPQEQWNKFLKFCKVNFRDDEGETLAIEYEEEFEERIKSFVGDRYLYEDFEKLFQEWNG